MTEPTPLGKRWCGGCGDWHVGEIGCGCPTCSGPIRETVGMVCPTCKSNHAQKPVVTEPQPTGHSRLPSGEWRCVQLHRTEPCGECEGCREVQAENAVTEPEPKAVAVGPSANGANPLVPAKPTATEILDRLDEARAREREWASGVCPDSGKAIHSCHRSVCDCFGAEDCASCGGTR